MFKKIFALICFALFLGSMSPSMMPTAANAEVVQATPIQYNPANDIPAWQLNVRNPSAELIQELRGGTFSAELLPIDEDTLLFYGTFVYHHIKRETAHNTEYDGDVPKLDAYAVAVDTQGERKWSLRIGDPQAENGFSAAWQLPDGRIMLEYNNRFGEWGSQYYIVSKDGEVQEMLPSYKAKAYGVSDTLKPLHGGYLGGGAMMWDSALHPMTDGANLTFFDTDLNMLWQNQSETYRSATLLYASEAADGILLSGTYQPDFGSNPETPYASMARMMPMVTKIGLDGQTKWTYVGHEYASTWAGEAVPTADGGALFITGFDPSVASLFGTRETGTLVKLDGNGELEWVRQYQEEHPFSSFTHIVPYQEGFLLSGELSDEARSCAVLYVASDGTPIQRIDLALEEPDAPYSYGYVEIAASASGNVYAYCVAISYDSPSVDMDQNLDCKLFYLPMADVLNN